MVNLNFISLIKRIYPIILIVFLLISVEAYGLHIRTHYKTTRQQRRAQHPPPDKKWLSKNPEGIILGRYRQYYFAVPEDANSSGLINILTLGGSGSGKSTLLGASLITTTYLKGINPEDKSIPHFLVIDLKGELHRLVNADSYFLIDPTDREHSVGWDPYSRLRDNPDHDLKIEVFSVIARSLIPSTDKDKYFSENAIVIFIGLLDYGYENGKGLVDVVDEILTGDIVALIVEAYENSDVRSIAAHCLGKFQGKQAKNESYSDILSTLTTNLSCFALHGVSYILRENPRKIGADSVIDKNVFLSIPDNMLTESQYAPIFRLMLEQTMTYLISTIPGPGYRPIGVIIDEVFALGRLPNLERSLSLGRGYGVFHWLLTQGTSGIEKIYGKEGARIIMENCRVKTILECTDSASADLAVGWAGTYHEKKTSYATVSKGKGNISWQDQNVFHKSDFADLVERNKTIVFSPSGMSQIDKVQWFKVKEIVEMQQFLKKAY